MKNILKTMLAASALLSTTTIFAQDEDKQSGFHVRLNVGYGFSTTNDVFSNTHQVTDTSGTTTTNIYGTLGSGTTFHLGVGYFINQYLGFEIDGYFLLGDKKEAAYIKNSFQEFTAKAWTQQIRVAPSIVLRAGGESKFKPYARFGIVLPVGGKTIASQYTKLPQLDGTTDINDRIVESHGKFTVGFESGVGLAYGITDNLSITAELTYSAVRIQTKESKVTKWDYTDASANTTTDRTTTAPTNITYLLESKYVNELTPSSNNGDVHATYDASKPKDELVRSTNFSSIAIRIGAMYRF